MQTLVDTLEFARGLRRRGLHGAAVELLDLALDQDELRAPTDGEIASQAAWLQLERAELRLAAGAIASAAADAQVALTRFEETTDRAGVAASCLLLGDLAYLLGDGVVTGWWARARSEADAAGAVAIAARALLAMALREWANGDASVAQTLLHTAEMRAHLEPAAVTSAATTQQQLAVRVAIATVRARHAVLAQRWAEARLLLTTAVDAARQVGDPALLVDCLQADAWVARRAGEPLAAVEGLSRAVELADHAGDQLLAWRLRAECALAATDAADLALAARLLQGAPPASIAALPAVQALWAEAVAALAHAGGDWSAAAQAWQVAAHARESLQDEAGRCRVLSAHAESLRRAGRPTEAAQLAEDALDLAQRLQRPELAVAAELARAHLAAAQGRLTVQGAERLVQAAAQVGSVAEQLAALDLAVTANLLADQVDRAYAAASQAVTLAQAQPLVRLHARAQAQLARTVLARGDLVAAQRAAVAALQLADTAGDLAGRTLALLVGGDTLAALGRADEARVVWAQATTAAAAAKRADLTVAATIATAASHAGLHDFLSAGALFATAAAQAQSAGLPAVHVTALLGQAWCARGLGRTAQAAAFARQALDEAEQSSGDLQVVRARIELAEQALLVPDPVAAQQWVADLTVQGLAAEGLAAQGPAAQGEIKRIHAQALAMQGRVPEALTQATAAVQALRAVRDERALGAALLLSGQISALAGDGHRAGLELGEALVLTARLGLPEAALVRTILARLQGHTG